MSSKLVLIDGHSLAFRAYHALPPAMATREGEPTNATYGFFSMLLNVLRDEQPEFVAVAFDVGTTFRHEEDPDYKGHRERMPEDLERQIREEEQVNMNISRSMGGGGRSTHTAQLCPLPACHCAIWPWSS